MNNNISNDTSTSMSESQVHLENKDGPLIIFGIIFILLIPVIFSIISLSNKDTSNIVCKMKDSDTKEISYEIRGKFTGLRVDLIEYIVKYDISNLSLKDIEVVRKDETELGNLYKEENKVNYNVKEENDSMVLTVYGKDKDVINFYDSEIANNKKYLIKQIENKGFTCE